ncbi:hypothetical protein GGS21DRAFT_542308 [Xylaria nigripes]|nr:hypothetical protein GGS21DRAFT_542308 [Xylaria nigripes]
MLVKGLFTKPATKAFTYAGSVVRRFHSKLKQNNSGTASSQADAEQPELKEYQEPIAKEYDDRLGNLCTRIDDLLARTTGEMSSTQQDSPGEAPAWTRQEDRIICTMRCDGKSWGEIGQKLYRSRRECQYRYHMLGVHAKELGITPRVLAKMYADEEEALNSTKQGEGDKREVTTKLVKEKKATTKADTTKPKKKREPASSSGNSSSSDANRATSSSSSEVTQEDSLETYWAHRRYVYDIVQGEMFPNQKVLRPDANYTESDCRILAGLEARYRAQKWLQIQADFCNATGRMVDEQLLRAKFYEK